MKRKTKIKLRKLFQAIYLLTFFALEIKIAGNIELGLKTPAHTLILFIISGLLTVSKMIYCSIKYPNAKYVWH